MACPLRPSARSECVLGGRWCCGSSCTRPSSLAASLLRVLRACSRTREVLAYTMWERLLCVLLLAWSHVAAAASSHNPVPPLSGQSTQVSVECPPACHQVDWGGVNGGMKRGWREQEDLSLMRCMLTMDGWGKVVGGTPHITSILPTRGGGAEGLEFTGGYFRFGDCHALLT
jgi:hypothetical protein